MATQTAAIVLADIGGYTRFMKKQEAALVHTEAVIADLLDSVIDTVAHPLTLNKLRAMRPCSARWPPERTYGKSPRARCNR